MKNSCITGIVLVITLLMFAFDVEAKKYEKGRADFTHLDSLKNTSYHLLRAKTLNHDYHIYVRLPADYDKSSKTVYPTIYLLDGDITFPLLGAYSQYLSLAEDIPDLIIIGIAYGTDDYKEGNNRSTDFTASAESRDYWGGAAKFQNMIVKELFPLIENNYPSNKDRRILFGQSLGGQFAIYNTLTKPEMFWGSIASNPALHRNLDFYLENHSDSKIKPRLFVSRAELNDERYKIPEEKWVKHWRMAKDKPFIWKTSWVANHNHFSVAPDSFRNGLMWLFSEE